MVEKTGHKKQMQSIRMEWINAGKPKSSVRESSVFDEPYLARREDDEREKTAPRVAPIFEKSASERPKTPVLDADGEMEMGDLYDATPKAPRQRHSQGEAESQDSLFGRGTTLSRPVTEVDVPDAPQEDELDALLAEDDTVQTEVAETKLARTASKARAPQDDQFNDDMEAMAEMDDLWG
jgi:replication fork protection complex subunit Csm3/Swi3